MATSANEAQPGPVGGAVLETARLRLRRLVDDDAHFILRLLNFTSYDPLKSGLKLPAVRILAALVGAQLGIVDDAAR